MIYLLHGEDTLRSREKLREIRARFVRVAGGDEAAVTVQAAETSLADLRALLETGSLFRSKRLVMVEELSCASPEVRDYFKERAAALAASEDIIVLWERGAASETAAAIEKHAAKAQEFTQRNRPRAGALKNNRVFAFTDALGARRPREALLLYHELIAGGENAEKLFWAVAWHVRTLATLREFLEKGVPAAAIERSVKLHPFVIKKGLAQARNFSSRELAGFYARLSELDTSTKERKADIAAGLERAILAV